MLNYSQPSNIFVINASVLIMRVVLVRLCSWSMNSSRDFYSPGIGV